MQLTPDQQSVFDAVVTWHDEDSAPYQTVGGYAGCFTGDTLVLTLDGSTKKLIDLYNEQSKNIGVYSTNLQGDPKVSIADKVILTKYVTELVKIVIDNKYTITSSLDQLFLLWDGDYQRADALREGDALTPISRKKYPGKLWKDREYVVGKNKILVKEGKTLTHKLSSEFNIKNGTATQNQVIHHIDYNQNNNHPFNIKNITRSNHLSIHANNPKHPFRKYCYTSEEVSSRNRQNWKKKAYRKHMIEFLKKRNEATPPKLIAELNYLSRFQEKTRKSKVLSFISKMIKVYGEDITIEDYTTLASKMKGRKIKLIGIAKVYDCIIDSTVELRKQQYDIIKLKKIWLNILQDAAKYTNHEITKIDIIKVKKAVPVFDIKSVKFYNNYAIALNNEEGIIVHNCGKTTLVTKLVEELSDTTEIACACFTGKATNVLQQKLTTPVDISTIHSLIYESELIDDGKKSYWIHHLKHSIPYELIIIDEASMISQDIFNDLMSFGIPLLFVGDHGQLPPVNDSFNIMKDPKLRLEKIHRQAEGNPIIKWSMWVREGKLLPYTKEETDLGSIQRIKSDITDDLLKDKTINDLPLFICGTNRTRQHINKKVRKHLFNNSSILQVTEKVICLKNNKKKQIFNGQVGTITDLSNEDCDNNYVATTIEMDGGSFFNGKLLKEQFGFLPRGPYQTFEDYVKSLRINPMFIHRFDYGYCLTTHKAQGSQAPTVVVYNENIYRSDPAMYRRWLYTAITRAEKNLILIG